MQNPNLDKLKHMTQKLVSVEEEKEEALEQLRISDLVLQSSLNAVAISDLDGSITYVNPAFLNMWGYKSDYEVLGKSLLDIVSFESSIKKVLTNSKNVTSWLGETITKNKAGKEFSVQVMVIKIRDANGEHIRSSTIFIDNTECELGKQQLQQTITDLKAENVQLTQKLTNTTRGGQ